MCTVGCCYTQNLLCCFLSYLCAYCFQHKFQIKSTYRFYTWGSSKWHLENLEPLSWTCESKVATTLRTSNAVFCHSYAYTVCRKNFVQKGCTCIAVAYRVATQTEKLNRMEEQRRSRGGAEDGSNDVYDQISVKIFNSIN